MYIIFKVTLILIQVKSTDKNAFEVDPSKGIISPRETFTIKVYTAGSVDSDYAKVLAQENKFKIEYGVVSYKPDSVHNAVSKLKATELQSIKLCINTDCIRGPRNSKPFNEASAKETNRYSYHSMPQRESGQVGPNSNDNAVEEMD
jgi:hypothetical protein